MSSVIDDAWDINPELETVKSELESLGADNFVGLYLSIIESSADRAKSGQADIGSEQMRMMLSELNTLLRSLERSKISATKLSTKLSALSDDARLFLVVEITRLQHQASDLDAMDWSDQNVRARLKIAADKARKWVRQTPGSKTNTPIHGYCRKVTLVYSTITSKSPGVGGSSTIENYMTPLERLWHVGLQLIQPNATILQAREIFRRASTRR